VAAGGRVAAGRETIELASRQIEALAALQQIDQRLREATATIETHERRLAELESALTTASQTAAAAREAAAVLESRQRDLEQRLGACDAKLKDRRMRMTRIRTDKELGLARREIDLLSEEKSTIETELLTVLGELEEAAARREAAEAELAAMTAERDAAAEALREVEAQLGARLAADRQQREALVAAVDGELRRRYEMIFARRNGLAVVAVRAGTCQGCRMRVPPQLFNQIQRGEQVILCPSCQRLLYWEPEREEAEPS